MADLYDLLTSDDEVAAQRAAALQKALRRDRAFGFLAAATGNKNLSGLGQPLLASAQQREEALADAGRFQVQQLTRRAMQEADAAYRSAVLGETQRHNKAMESARPPRSPHYFTGAGGAQFYVDPANPGRALPVRGPDGSAVTSPVSSYPPKAVEDDIQALGKDLEQAAKMRPDLETLQAAARASDTAGFGQLAGRLPDFATSQEGIANRQAAGRIMANIIQMISGQAASEAEVARHLEARGLGRTAAPAAFRKGVEALQQEFATIVAQRQAKYRPEVVAEYAKRGGFTSGAQGGTEPANPVRKFVRGPDGRLVEVKP